MNYKRYKRKRMKPIKLIILFVIILATFLCMSSGYALFSDNSKIIGKANIKSSDQPDGEKGNSTYTFKIANSWANGGEVGVKNYGIDFTIENKDEDIKEWIVEFDVLNGVPDNVNCWSASEVTIKDHTVKLVAQSWNANLPSGSKVTIGFNFIVNSLDKLEIGNVKLNGKIISRRSN